ncbi:shikimate kinase [Aestuariibius insulae]|uniref:shikimate kinase n=1 Tax=Aestuariibius insulae TaxID=2058287 RepID=UPI00345E6666
MPIGGQVELRLVKTVALVGMMGSGKTAVGRALAARLDVPFRDSDTEIVEAAQASIAEIFERDGEAFFRDREAEVIARLVRDEPVILSTGGGAFLAERNRHVISEAGLSVWLKADLELLWERVRHKETRPLLQTPDPKGTLTQIFNARQDIYALADVAVEAEPCLSIAEMADRVLATISGRTDVLKEVS